MNKWFPVNCLCDSALCMCDELLITIGQDGLHPNSTTQCWMQLSSFAFYHSWWEKVTCAAVFSDWMPFHLFSVEFSVITVDHVKPSTLTVHWRLNCLSLLTASTRPSLGHDAPLICLQHMAQIKFVFIDWLIPVTRPIASKLSRNCIYKNDWKEREN